MNQEEREPIPFVADTDRLLNAKEVGARLRCSAGFVYVLVQRGDLIGIRVGRLMRVRQSDLDAYIAAQPAIRPTVAR